MFAADHAVSAPATVRVDEPPHVLVGNLDLGVAEDVRDRSQKGASSVGCRPFSG